uniref:ShKT domain-containing protein n=1 Tax=Rhabditophanes sp. KR3021 TaxID=114890 RepID=A0AC35TWF7_9BILA
MKAIICVSLALLAVYAYGCSDNIEDCVYWIDLCGDNTYVDQNCKRTCNSCTQRSTAKPCYDVGENCYQLNICNNQKYADIAWRECRRTCNLCNAPDPYLSSRRPYQYTTSMPSTTTRKYTPYNSYTTKGPCFDSIGTANCDNMMKYCWDRTYAPLMREECAYTCGYCR